MFWLFYTAGVILKLLHTIDYKFKDYAKELRSLFSVSIVLLLFILSFTIYTQLDPAQNLNYGPEIFLLSIIILIPVFFARSILSQITTLRSFILCITAIFLLLSENNTYVLKNDLLSILYLSTVTFLTGITALVLFTKTVLPKSIAIIASLCYLLFGLITFLLFFYQLILPDFRAEFVPFVGLLYGFVTLEFIAYCIYLVVLLFPIKKITKNLQGSYPTTVKPLDRNAILILQTLKQLLEKLKSLQQCFYNGDLINRNKTSSFGNTCLIFAVTIIFFSVNLKFQLLQPATVALIVLSTVTVFDQH